MADKEIVVIAWMKARSGLESKVRETLTALLAPTRSEDGCIRHDLHELRDQPGMFSFYEVWRSQADLETHLEQPYLKDLKAHAEELFEGPIELSIWKRVEI